MARTLEAPAASQPEGRKDTLAEGSRPTPASEARFVSLDFFRGLTMFILIAESTRIYEHLVDPADRKSVV